VAAARGAHGLSAGNLIGSNIFNTMGVVGIAGVLLQPPLADPVRLTHVVVPSLGGFLLVVIVMLVFMMRGLHLSRAQGGVLVLLGVARWVLDFLFRGAV
jgi:cation:H+ antiporter